MKVRSILEDMPWLSWEKMAGQLDVSVQDKGAEQAYNDVRRNLIYTYIEKVYYEYDTEPMTSSWPCSLRAAFPAI